MIEALYVRNTCARGKRSEIRFTLDVARRGFQRKGGPRVALLTKVPVRRAQQNARISRDLLFPH